MSTVKVLPLTAVIFLVSDSSWLKLVEAIAICSPTFQSTVVFKVKLVSPGLIVEPIVVQTVLRGLP